MSIGLRVSTEVLYSELLRREPTIDKTIMARLDALARDDGFVDVDDVSFLESGKVALPCVPYLALFSEKEEASIVEILRERGFRKYSFVGKPQTDENWIQGVNRTTYIVQEGEDSLNRFRIIRLSKREAAGTQKKQLMMIAGSAFGSDFFMKPGANDKRSETVAGFIVRKGVDVWMIDSRYTVHPGNGFSTCLFDKKCLGDERTKEWDADMYASDVLFAAGMVREQTDQKPILFGHSLGGMIGEIVMMRAPHLFDGAIIHDSFLRSSKKEIHDINQGPYLRFKRLYDEGVYLDTEQNPFFHAVAKKMTNPWINSALVVAGIGSIGFFQSVIANSGVNLALETGIRYFSTHYDELFPENVPGYKYSSGDIWSYDYAESADSLAMMQGLDMWMGVPLHMDLYACLADAEECNGKYVPDENNMFRAPIFMIGCGKGFGTGDGRYMKEGLRLFATPADQVSWKYFPDYAHADNYTAPEKRQELADLIIGWLKDI